MSIEIVSTMNCVGSVWLDGRKTPFLHRCSKKCAWKVKVGFGDGDVGMLMHSGESWVGCMVGYISMDR